MKLFKFKTKSNALKKQASMKRNFGYSPSIIKVKSPKKRLTRYVVVRPSGLRRIR